MALVVYVFLLFGASKIALDTWIPPTSEQGLWFYSGLAALLLGNLLVSPYFTKPIDAISFSVAALIALLTVRTAVLASGDPFDAFLWAAAAVHVTAVLLAGTLSIALRDEPPSFRSKLSRSLFYVAEAAGSPRVLFSTLFLLAVVVFHRGDPREYVTITVAWALVVVFQPIEAAIALVRKIAGAWRVPRDVTAFGRIVGHQSPGLVLVQKTDEEPHSFGEALVLQGEDAGPCVALALDRVGFAEGQWIRALDLPLATMDRLRAAQLLPSAALFHGVAYRFDTAALQLDGPARPLWSRREEILGFVAPGTDLSTMLIEVVRVDRDIKKSRLVEVEVAGVGVLYQVLDGLTREEILVQKSTCGFVQAKARKIGTWQADRQRFKSSDWVPEPNTPVFLAEPGSAELGPEAVGHFPGTSYPVTLNVGHLVSHNTAVLGILGVGKTFLALELVERMLEQGIRVLCLDMTTQYQTELAPHTRKRSQSKVETRLKDIGRAGKTKVSKHVEDGGSVKGFKAAALELMRRFLDPRKPYSLLVFNPNSFEVWRQDSKPYMDKASMASLTAAEVTRIFSEATLEVLQEQGMTDESRCCLVYEEAHSLIPEWNAVAYDGDKAATNGTARAILQGRKFGLGCLVVTQRTASVTKTVLNQCNTVFAMRSFDATGMEFLANFIGKDYAGVLSTLEDRHAVVFGRASSCRDPVLIRVNDRPDFVRRFRGSQAD